MMQRQGTDRPRAPEQRKRTNPAQQPIKDRTSPTQFLTEVRGELRRVAWPTKQEVINSTIVVLICVVIITSLIFAFDWASAKAVLHLYS
jgi:preprotein translocase subunit SecE